MDTPMTGSAAEEVKSCCARLYETDLVRNLLGESFHPGGLRLTTRIGQLLGLSRSSRLLDVASGKGDSALHLAETFGCEVVGIDYSSANVSFANKAALERGVAGRVTFQQADAERLPFADGTFDGVLCECAYCTFPDKRGAASEFYRVLGPNGRVGMSDIVRAEVIPPDLDTLLAWVACIADAQPAERYAELLSSAEFCIDRIEPHNRGISRNGAADPRQVVGYGDCRGFEETGDPRFRLRFGETTRWGGNGCNRTAGVGLHNPYRSAFLIC